MNLILILAALLGLSLADPQKSQESTFQIEKVPQESHEDTLQIEEVPDYAPLSQTKIIELYEFLKAELEGDDVVFEEPNIEIVDQALRNKRSAEPNPFFLRHLFGRRHYGYGGHRRHYGHGGYGHGGYGHRHYHGHGYNRGYNNYGRHYYH